MSAAMRFHYYSSCGFGPNLVIPAISDSYSELETRHRSDRQQSKLGNVDQAVESLKITNVVILNQIGSNSSVLSTVSIHVESEG